MNKFLTISYFDKAFKLTVRRVQEEISELTGSRACLETHEPHLTVGSGVVVAPEKINDFYMKLENALRDIKPFKLSVVQFKFLGYPRVIQYLAKRNRRYVIYLKVKKNKDLMRLVLNLRKVNAEHKKFYRQPWRYYVPHITVAFDDLSYEGYIKAKKIWKERMFSADVTINSVSIAVAGDDGKFVEHRQFSFGVVA